MPQQLSAFQSRQEAAAATQRVMQNSKFWKPARNIDPSGGAVVSTWEYTRLCTALGTVTLPQMAAEQPFASD